MQEKARALLEKGLVEGRANFAKAKSAADEATSAIEASYGAAKDGVIEFNVKAIEAIKAERRRQFRALQIARRRQVDLGVRDAADGVLPQAVRSRLHAVPRNLAALARKVADDDGRADQGACRKTFKVAV